MEKNKKLFAPIEENVRQELSKSGKFFYLKFEITDSSLNITILAVERKKKLPP